MQTQATLLSGTEEIRPTNKPRHTVDTASESQVLLVPREHIEPDPDQPRKIFNKPELQELGRSIRARGLIQPITVRPHPNGEANRYLIVAGERRWRSHGEEYGNVDKCRVIVETNVSSKEVKLQQIVENLTRADLHPVEEAEAFNDMLQAGWSVQTLARDLGVKEFRIVQKLDLLKLIPEILQLVRTNNLSVYHGQEIAKLPPADQIAILNHLKKGRYASMPEIRTAVAAILDNKNQIGMDMGTSSKRAATEEEVAVVNKMEKRIEQVAEMVGKGWKEGECIIAKKVSPDRLALMADKMVEIKKALGIMEKQLRLAAVQGELGDVKKKAPKSKHVASSLVPPSKRKK